ncbi:DUF2288 domain-containing protein [Endozoicomonas gorgoniicola]|uniref:DUF2288 domain-containing protein n=1 Tax=Endozoicomonas gorgoniicola TaxID=1234144 RepID=A0ABT3MPK8_9GAMM|nr:DUF2288 domain-containing protein [Endozoicomonas gorgoniicola]MCW7551315.1 DUF2288 domain-containing protein [Endozoicomonas gorgoniicola]
MEVKEKLNLETARIPWKELERFFAQGIVLNVTGSLDLLDAGCAFASDDTQQVQGWLEDGQLEKVTDQQALEWHKLNPELWSVVVRPWILVQDRP